METLPSTSDRLRILRLNGPVTLGTLFDFQSTVRSDDSRSLVVDMSNVPYVDSAGIGCLVGAHVSHERNGRKFVLAGINERVRNTLKITYVENVFAIYDNLDDAIAAFARSAIA